ncbi:hypothetical protein B0P06_004681 [Clostridium saccharoperbutylacetonicum]|uniref:Transposase n=1 Tax=Clostridium saccharoperbutylacetonicum N1-4(HMT) TaxID=931276 RepID=M1N0C7_9CLOT|nr:Tn3 family transposase [Clostridium saccharoperbutylacetonicum]AGF57032.1 transposase [Clostridium saccharoperbutylacetonicum N1-4(HMT)]NRT62209.1 hypothetical protein [Clostridium saccharoperbutylacetonicum]NSB44910.1 hypothetical protein [Clostridium saccharoperbutylacetonicum]
MNALARAIFFVKRREFRERELQDQFQRASALNILINAIIIWNTTYLQKAVDHLKQSYTFDESLLKNIAPLGWEHINLLGEYNFDTKNIPELYDIKLPEKIKINFEIECCVFIIFTGIKNEKITVTNYQRPQLIQDDILLKEANNKFERMKKK